MNKKETKGRAKKRKERFMKVGIVMGSHSDLPVVKQAQRILEQFDVEYETRILSAHRTPESVRKYMNTAEKKGVGVFIGVAGKAAHLPGVMAAATTAPVIGLPIKTNVMGGMDSLLSMVQMPKGIPVATVAIDGGENAALLALSILGLSSKAIKDKLVQYRKFMRDKVLEEDRALQKENNSTLEMERQV